VPWVASRRNRQRNCDEQATASGHESGSRGSARTWASSSGRKLVQLPLHPGEETGPVRGTLSGKYHVVTFGLRVFLFSLHSEHPDWVIVNVLPPYPVHAVGLQGRGLVGLSFHWLKISNHFFNFFYGDDAAALVFHPDLALTLVCVLRMDRLKACTARRPKTQAMRFGCRWSSRDWKAWAIHTASTSAAWRAIWGATSSFTIPSGSESGSFFSFRSIADGCGINSKAALSSSWMATYDLHDLSWFLFDNIKTLIPSSYQHPGFLVRHRVSDSHFQSTFLYHHMGRSFHAFTVNLPIDNPCILETAIFYPQR